METGKSQRLGTAKAPPSQTNARALLIRALEMGRTDIRGHFSDRCDERGLSTIDAENLIRCGTLETPRYDIDHDNWVYEIVGRVDGKSWKIVVALDCGEDMWDSPLITLVTVHRVGGKRRRRAKKHENDTAKMSELRELDTGS